MSREVPGTERRSVARPDGAAIAVQTWGDPDGEPVLLLHGALSTAEQNYRLVLAPLGARHRLIGVDLRGHGRSADPAGAFSLEALRDDALAVLDDLDLAKVHVLGTSLGGYTALALRAAAPDRVATLALAGVKPGWTRGHAEERRGFFSPEGILGEYPHWEKYLTELHGDWRALTTRVGDLLAGLPDEPAVSWERLVADGEGLPLFFCVGDRDALVPLATAVEVRERRPDSQVLVVPRAGHLFREYDPGVFSAAYLAFTRRHRVVTG